MKHSIKVNYVYLFFLFGLWFGPDIWNSLTRGPSFVNVNTLWLGYLVFAVLLYKGWRWSGTALPPASLVNKKWMGSPVEQVGLPSQPEALEIPSDVKFGETVRIASDYMCIGAPFFEMVRVRAWIIELFTIMVLSAVLIELGVEQIYAVNDTILAHPFISLYVVN